METYNFLLCCSCGMSSGYLAMSTRKAAKKKGLKITVEAVSQENVVDKIKDKPVDILLIGPQYSSQLGTMKEILKDYKTVVRVIPSKTYGELDGSALIDFALNAIKEEKL